MASPTRVQEFPEADVVGDLTRATTMEFTADPISSVVAQSKEYEEQAQAKKENQQQERKDATQKLKSTIIISGVIVAVVGAIFAITKTLREK
ncbi:hypothetical protein IFM89_031032 [Coptis chinensis]|uniref:Uncharacterized protein n=1 Tax=Coptis chinensis TaxID=261450 RepID=A0A835LH12_9MAGN|nr:hypothetical protein IFM89_031032 [Coptis chinensis]